MRTNSPMDDPQPFEMPVFEQPEEPKKPKKKNNIDRKGVDEYIQGRIAYFDKYLPNGESVLDKDPAEIGMWWQMAATLKAEFEALNAIVQGKNER